MSGDGFNSVVAIKRLRFFEVTERSAGATSAAHVDGDIGISESREELTKCGVVGVAWCISRVFDNRGVRAVFNFSWEHDVDGKGGSITCGQISEARGWEFLFGIETLLGNECGVIDHDFGAGSRQVGIHDLVQTNFKTASQERALFIGRAFSRDGSVFGLDLQISARFGVNDRNLMGARTDRICRQRKWGQRGAGLS